MTLRIFIAALTLLSLSTLVSAQEVDPARLEELKNKEAAEKSREGEIQAEKSQVTKEISSLSKDIKSVSSGLAKLEKDQLVITSELDVLNLQKTETETKIMARKASVTDLLAALQRIESNPPPPLATHPDDAAKASRAGLLLRSLTGQISERVTALNVDLERFDVLQTEIVGKQAELSRNQSAMNSRRSKMQKSVNEKHKLERSLNADLAAAQRRQTALAQEAKNLEDLIAKLERKSRDIVPRIKPDPDAPDPEPASSAESVASKPVTFAKGDLRFSSSKGKLYPVTQGKLIKRYSSGHPGLSIKAGDGGQIWSPASGRVEFAGPFKNYDQVVILNVGDGYYVLLTGLGQLLVQNDSKVTAGEPVGLMPVNSPNDDKLYIELRKNGSTIDPVPWFGTTFAQQNKG